MDTYSEEESIHPGNLMESQVSHLDDLLNEKLEQAFHKQTSHVVFHELTKIALEHSPIDLAYAASRLPPNIRPLIYENLSSTAQVEFMVNTDATTRNAVFCHIDDLSAKKLIEQMAPDEAVSVIEGLSERRFKRLLELLEPAKARRIREIRKHPSDRAGRLMTNEFFAFSEHKTVGQVAATIHNNPGIDLTHQIFVVGETGELLGFISARTLIINPRHLRLSDLMRPIVHKVSPESTREEVVEIAGRYKIAALPVVDVQGRLVGVISHEDVLETVEDLADETIAKMAGTAEKVSEQEPVRKRFFARAPWLFVTLFAGLVNVGVISSFQKYEGGVLTFVLFFVPLITGMSGNIGIQCSTVLVRSMATGLLSPGNRREVMFKELLLGAITGSIFGFLCGAIVYALEFLGIAAFSVAPEVIGLVVGVGLAGGCLAGSLLGVFSPFFFARLGVDPAIASGPIITAFNDFLSMAIYFLIAIGLSAWLLG